MKERRPAGRRLDRRAVRLDGFLTEASAALGSALAVLLFGGSPFVPEAVAQALAKGKLLSAHPSNAAGLNAALAGGVDVVVHTAPGMVAWSDSLVARMVKEKVAVIPTLKLWRYETRSARLAFSRPFAQAGVDELRAFHRGGGRVLFGTDVGYMLDYDTAEEFALMAEAGMDFPAILASLTTNPARKFGVDKVSGRVAPGMDADLVVLEGDPAGAIRALARVRYTVRQGRVIYRKAHSTSRRRGGHSARMQGHRA